ncbi:MAG: SpoIID/LytB domain-containing protein [Firmicutes bacterium]|nr:SpoIID/LytB domain-containing protein [Bacillota bacterium]
MRRRWVYPVLLLFLLPLLLPADVRAGGAMDSIRVGLILGQRQVGVKSPGGLFVEDLSRGECVGEGRVNETLQISGLGTQIQVGGLGVFPGPLRLKARDGGIIDVNNNPYWGEIEVFLRDGLLTVVNILPVEEYLCGVVSREMPASFPLEALKAQAVAARTYTYANWNKHLGEGFNLCATVDCQVYGGAAAVTPKVIEAVGSTAGQVLRYNGNLINAYYHASSGGYTENSENVWSESVPYLRGVPDYDYDSPYTDWSLVYSPQELSDILRQGGLRVGRINKIEPLSRGVSGRVCQVRISGSEGSQILTGNELRNIMGSNELRSTLFEVEIQRKGESMVFYPLRPGQRVTVLGGDEEKYHINLTGAAVLGGHASLAVGFGSYEQEQVVFSGSGWGHGLGLSQWGAKAMAEMAPASDDEFYKAILMHYYQGAKVEPL